jgi:hypothetical protein
MVRIEGFFPDCQCARKQRLGLVIAVSGLVERCQAAKRSGNKGVIGIERLLRYRQGPLQATFRLGELTTLPVQCAQIVERVRHFRMLAAERFFPHGQCPFQRAHGLGVAFAGLIDDAEIVQHARKRGMIRRPARDS